jgi:hypothetical protein
MYNDSAISGGSSTFSTIENRQLAENGVPLLFGFEFTQEYLETGLRAQEIGGQEAVKQFDRSWKAQMRKNPPGSLLEFLNFGDWGCLGGAGFGRRKTCGVSGCSPGIRRAMLSLSLRQLSVDKTEEHDGGRQN